MAIETTTQEAADIYNYASESIETSLASSTYPAVTNVAAEVHDNLSFMREKVTISDIKEASAFLAQTYPNYTYPAFLDAFTTAFSDIIKQEEMSFLKDFTLIFLIVLGGYVLMLKKVR